MTDPSAPSALEARIFALERPDSRLMTYYVIQSFAAGPFFFFPLLFYSFRYRTLRYRFDREGVSMRWGVLFRREINLTYARIQDIHLSSNIVERWLGLAKIEIQTASGSAKAEMTVEGIPEFEELRDFLYSRMRGVAGHAAGGGAAAAPQLARRPAGAPAGATPGSPDPGGHAARHAAPAAARDDAELAAVLREVAAELRALRLRAGGGGGVATPPPKGHDGT